MKRANLTLPVIILKTATGYNAFSPEIDGCVASAKSVDTVLKQYKEAVQFHLEGEMLVKSRRRKSHTVLKDVFDDYGTEAVYASIDVLTD
ncbi:MAG: type II toxin-antitoxin system HicB family antitoxin [Pirellulales bacterium]|nr:type II toxin-antitoxin system HicB family antitoxin [Pirellulales bacterium]